MVCVSQHPRLRGDASIFILPKRSFDKLLSHTLNKEDDRAKAGEGQERDPSWRISLSCLFLPSPLCLRQHILKFHPRTGTGRHDWTSAPKVQDECLMFVGPGQVSAPDRILPWNQDKCIQFGLRLSAAGGPWASSQTSTCPRREDEVFLGLES